MTLSFYDHPSGRLYMRAPAGAGGSVFDGPATEDDIAHNPEAMLRYQAEKRAEAARADVAAAEQSELEQLRAENATLRAEMARVEAAIKPAPPTELEAPHDAS